MESWFGLIAGVLIILGGLALVTFNKQYTSVTRPMLDRIDIWRALRQTRFYRPGASGRAPIVTVIGVGWVIVGVVFVLVGVGVLEND